MKDQCKELCGLLGSQQCILGGSDDKCRVSIGLPAAGKQTKMLMRMDRRIITPDHDYVVAEKHKLVPSVTGFRTIENDDKYAAKSGTVKYGGETYVAIRSGKHSVADAWTHGIDILRCFELDQFKETLFFNGKVKPILFWESDGAADEGAKNERFKKIWMSIFKDFDLDLLCHYNSPPGVPLPCS